MKELYMGSTYEEWQDKLEQSMRQRRFDLYVNQNDWIIVDAVVIKGEKDEEGDASGVELHLASYISLLSALLAVLAS